MVVVGRGVKKKQKKTLNNWLYFLTTSCQLVKKCIKIKSKEGTFWPPKKHKATIILIEYKLTAWDWEKKGQGA